MAAEATAPPVGVSTALPGVAVGAAVTIRPGLLLGDTGFRVEPALAVVR